MTITRTDPNYLIIGQGKIGIQVSAMLDQQGNCVSVMARGQKTDAYLDKYGLDKSNFDQKTTYIQADACTIDADTIKSFSHIAIIVAPNRIQEEDYQQCYLAIASHIGSLQADLTHLQRLIFISSTGVYGENSGEWIDETTVAESPTRKASQFILQAEQVLQTAFTDKLVIIRPSGIYGKHRRMRIHQAMKTDKPLMVNNGWTNRIMDTDLVVIICHVLQMAAPKALYLASDYQPVTTYEVMTWLSTQLGTTAPTIASDLILTGKRIHSNIPLSWLQFPDWQQGYRHILDADH